MQHIRTLAGKGKEAAIKHVLAQLWLVFPLQSYTLKSIISMDVKRIKDFVTVACKFLNRA